MKYLALASLFVLCIGLQACMKQMSKEKPDIYVASELALLMRSMEKEQLQLRKDILKGNDNPISPIAHLALNTAEPTQEGTINDTYKSYSELFTIAMSDLQHGDSTMVYRFNQGIKACVNCHEQFCGGPIQRIEKLYLPAN